MSNLDTSIGLVVPTMAEIQSAFVAQINDKIDPSFAIENDNLLAQIVVILSQECSNMFDTLQNAYDVLNPETARGLNLDDACKYIGVSRGQALATKVYLLLSSATDGDVFPANTDLSASGFTISSASDITMSSSTAAQASVQVLNAVEGYTYSFELDDILISYTADVTDTIQDIAIQLKDSVIADAALFTAIIDPEDDSQIIVNQTTAGDIDYSNAFVISIASPEGLSISSVSAYAPLLNNSTGNITIPAGTFTLSSTPIAGISSFQAENGINGQPEDSDQVLRIKRDLALGYGGNRTIASIQAAVLTTQYVQKAKVYQNTADTSEDLSPGITLLPHSIYAVALGGYKVDIATSIYNRMSEGIQTNGETPVALTDEFENYILINFDYATQVAVSLNIAVVIDKTVLFKINKNVVPNIQAAILQYIQTLGIGETMYMESLISVAGCQVEYGIRSISVSYTILPSATIYNVDLVTLANQIVVVNEDNILVTVSAT